MARKTASLRHLKADADKAQARAAAAKQQVRLAKAQLKQARKLFKTEKKAAKQAKKKVAAAREAFWKAEIKESAPETAGDTKVISRSKATVGTKAAPSAKTAKRADLKRAVKSLKPRRASTPRKPQGEDSMRSAAEVAKSVIERLHAPPQSAVPLPLVSPSVRRGGQDAGDENGDQGAQEQSGDQRQDLT